MTKVLFICHGSGGIFAHILRCHDGQLYITTKIRRAGTSKVSVRSAYMQMANVACRTQKISNYS